MIVVDLSRAAGRLPAHPPLGAAVAFLRGRDLAALPEGRVEIDGDRVYALVQGYETLAVDEPRFEWHRRFIDLQLVESGAEVIGWAPAALITVTEAYDRERDVGFGVVGRGLWTPLRLTAGQLAVLWPEDAHAPRLAAGAPTRVRKIVVKVAV